MMFLCLPGIFYIVDSMHTGWVLSRIIRNVQPRLGEKADLLATSMNSRISLLYDVKNFVEADPRQARLEREFDRIARLIAGDAPDRVESGRQRDTIHQRGLRSRRNERR